MTLALAWRILTHQKGRTALGAGRYLHGDTAGLRPARPVFCGPPGRNAALRQHAFRSAVGFGPIRVSGATGRVRAKRSSIGCARPRCRGGNAALFCRREVEGWRGRRMAGPLRASASTRPVTSFCPTASTGRRSVIERPDTILVDNATRPIFGPLTPGRVVDIGDRAVTIGGQYVLGTGFMGLGVALASEAELRPPVPRSRARPGQSRSDPAEAGDRSRPRRRAICASCSVLERRSLPVASSRRQRNGLLDDPHLGRADFRLRTADLDRRRYHGRLPDRFDPGEPAIAAIRHLEGDRL